MAEQSIPIGYKDRSPIYFLPSTNDIWISGIDRIISLDELHQSFNDGLFWLTTTYEKVEAMKRGIYDQRL